MLYSEIAQTNKDEDFLEHFGVKGMRWGQRRQQETSGSTKNSGRKLPKISNQTKIELGIGATALVLGVVGGRKLRDVRYSTAFREKAAWDAYFKYPRG